MISDQQLTRAALRAVLSERTEFEYLGEGSDVASARALIDLPGLRVLIVNLALSAPAGIAPGIAAIRYAKTHRPGIGVLSLKRSVDAHLLRAALDAGADACCLATTSANHLVGAISAVAQGATWLDREISETLWHGNERLDADGARLSPRELEILRLIVEGYSNIEIATQLACSPATIKTHLMHLFRKMKVRDRTSAAVHALRAGLI
ncbi:MAG: response regulator transcription factor [Vulcanimicrobiaceae bacterium]